MLDLQFIRVYADLSFGLACYWDPTKPALVVVLGVIKLTFMFGLRFF